jgi:hypothetical protein
MANSVALGPLDHTDLWSPMSRRPSFQHPLFAHTVVADHLADHVVADHVASLPGRSRGQTLLFELHSIDRATTHRLGHRHPLDVLLRWTAPHSTEGLALLSEGHVEASDHPLAAFAVGQIVRTVHIVTRDGSSQGRLLSHDGFEVSSGADGVVADAMCRSLGVATAPPTLPAAWYWLLVWMADIVELAPTANAREVVAWHPAVDPRDLTAVHDGDLGDFVRRLHANHADEFDWGSIRRKAMAGWLDVGSCPSDLAAWFDDGSFCRWLADQLPMPGDLLEVADSLLDEPVRAVVLPIIADLVPGGRRLRQPPEPL